MGRRLVVTVVLDEGHGDDVYDALAELVSTARGVVAWQVEARTTEGDQDLGGAAAPADEAELQAVVA
jgi:hypothetical protein